MTERSDAWYRSVLPNIGALTDTSSTGWVYLARVTTSPDGPERGLLVDVGADRAVTRAEALIHGRTLAEVDDPTKGADVLEEWVYTTEEAATMDFQQGQGGTTTTEVDDDCGCGGPAP